MMEFAHQSKPSLWNVLLWKDFQQVKSTFAVVVGCAFGLQLIFFLASLLIQDEEMRMGVIAPVLMIASTAPVLLAFGCSGMLIGHERQTGTWSWSSSLPVSWTQALASKMLVSVIGSLLACLPLAIMPIWFLMGTANRIPETTQIGVVVLGGFLIFVEVVAFCFVATLLMRDTLMALVVAAIAILFLNIFVPTWFAINSNVANFRWISNGNAEATAAAVSICGLVLTSGIFLFITFRWRWGVGQQASLAFWERLRVASLPSHAQYQFAAGTVPSEWWMLVRHASTNSFWLRLATVAGTLLMCMTPIILEPNFVPLILLPVAGCIFGITSFEGDRTLSRFRFLSDRGVDPWKLVLSRMGVAAIWALATILVVLLMSLNWRGFSERVLFAIGIIPVAFLVGSFASMCFRKPLIAVGAASVICIGALATTTSVVALVWRAGGSIVPLNWIVLYCAPAAILALLVGIFRMAKPWLVSDRDSLAVHCIWMSLAATLSPIFLASTFGFLLIPSVDLQIETTDFSPERQVAVPDFAQLAEVLCSELKPSDTTESFADLALVARSRGRGLEGVSRTANSIVSQVSSELEEQRKPTEMSLAAIFVPSIPRLEEIMNKEPFRVEASKVNLPKLEALIACTAALATIAMKEEDAESSVRLWNLNRRLQELAQQCNPLLTHASRNVSMHLLMQSSDEEIAAMGGADIVRSLIPSLPLERTASFEEMSQNVGLLRKSVSISEFGDSTMIKAQIAKYYPPLNWLIDRKALLLLDGEMKFMSKLPENFLTCQTRDPLVARVSQ